MRACGAKVYPSCAHAAPKYTFLRVCSAQVYLIFSNFFCREKKANLFIKKTFRFFFWEFFPSKKKSNMFLKKKKKRFAIFVTQFFWKFSKFLGARTKSILLGGAHEIQISGGRPVLGCWDPCKKKKTIDLISLCQTTAYRPSKGLVLVPTYQGNSQQIPPSKSPKIPRYWGFP